jgi:hypothetical protein
VLGKDMGILDFIFKGTNAPAMERRKQYEAEGFFRKVARSERAAGKKGTRTLEGASFLNMVNWRAPHVASRAKRGKK